MDQSSTSSFAAAPAQAKIPPPVVTDLETVERRSGYQALEAVRRPSYWGVDHDPERRPGVVTMRAEPRPWPNARFPPERQRGVPSSPLHGRPNKVMPPVFGTAVPLRGLSGVVRRLAYRLPDHYPSHWLLMMVGDRVEAWGHRVVRYLPLALPLAGIALIAYSRRRSR